MLKRRAKMIHAGVLASSAICAVGTCVPEDASADQANGSESPQGGASDMQEILVTATRHESKLIDVPYNISAVSGDELAQRGISDITNLGQIMPGIDFPNQGAGRDAFEEPIIRGLNLSPTGKNLQPVQGVAPVSTYIGDTPVSGRFPLNDLARVEVLRGPQGTLYGAGAIGGTIRLIPNDPQIGALDGRVDASISTVDHSSQPSYTAGGVVNVPLNDQLALRLSGEYIANAGFIDDINAVRRTSGALTARAIFANPNDVANSGSLRYTAKDVNWSETYGGRAALLVQATDAFRLKFSFDYSHAGGGDNPGINTTFPGGPDGVDPRTVVPAPGSHQELNYILEPYNRDLSLPAVDASWDLGFATLSSNTAYFDSHGVTVSDQTFGVLGIPAFIGQYYTGSPVFPRYMDVFVLSTHEKNVTEEVRFVSNTKGPLDYVAGAYFSHDITSWTTQAYAPGASAWDAAIPAPIIPIVVFPNSNELYFLQTNERSSIERALYGELTYHLTPTVQVTGGGRFYWFQNTSSNYVAGSALGGFASSSLNEFTGHGELGKLNASWNYVGEHKLYATYSQGYRPGGANGIALTGALAEKPTVLTYRPDHANNYEFGGKGTFGPALTYSLDIFYMDLRNAQLSEVTPNGWPVVVNTNGATTKGLEFEVNGRVIDHLTYNAGYSHTNATVSQAFRIPVAFGSISGTAGQQLPGSPRNSASASLTYDLPLGAYNVQTTAGLTYKGPMQTSLEGPTQNVSLPGYTLTNLNLALLRDKWRVALFVNNLTNVTAVTSAISPLSNRGPEGALEYVEPPREIGMRVGYSFGRQ
jgi:iron complex outermembrane receptor protein